MKLSPLSTNRAFSVCLYGGLVLGLLTGCGDDGGGSPRPSGIADADGTGDIDFVPTDVGGDPGPGVDATPTEGPLVIEFVTEKGDDNVSCKGQSRCTVIMSFNQSRDLEIRARRGTTPVGDLEMKWTISSNPNNSLKLAASTSYTLPEGDKKGVASNSVSQSSAQAQQYEVKVVVPGDASIAPLFFDVAVSPKGTVPLTVLYKYSGSRQFDAVTTYLLKQSQSKPHLCATIDPMNLPTADLSGPPKSLTQSTVFTNLPGLEQEGTQKYTVIGIGKDTGNGPILTWGCDDAKATVTLTNATTVQVQLADLPPLWKKKYDVTTKFDLISALPDNVEQWVDIVIGLFTDPAGQLLTTACTFGMDVSVIGDLCGAVYANDPCTEDSCYTSIGLAIKGLMSELLTDLIKKNQTASDIFFTGQDVATILTNLELESTYELTEEPNDDGTIVSSTTSTEWHTVTYRWTLGSGCDPADKSCGKRSFNVQAFQGNAITGNWSGRVDYDGAKNYLSIDPHQLKIKYGALLLYIIENELLPRLGGDGTDGLPKVDSIEEYLKVLVGGKECLKTEFEGTQTCCEAFADSITSGGTGITTDIAKLGCNAAVPLLDQELTKVFTNLDVDTGNAFQLSTDKCQCYDNDSNMTVDAWGKGEIEPCHWDTTITIGGADVDVQNDFWGVEQQ